MKKLRLSIFLLIALAQLAVPASMIWKRQQVLREGRLWKFRTAPVDPVDAMRGRYLSLRFAAERSELSAPLSGEGLPYVSLKNDSDGFAVVGEINYERKAGDNIIRAEYLGFYDGKVILRFPFNRLWVNEGDATAAEGAYQAHGRDDGYVAVRVGRGDAAIEELYLAGQPLREYLRSHPMP